MDAKIKGERQVAARDIRKKANRLRREQAPALRCINIIVLCGAVCELRVIVMHPTKERHSHTAVPFCYAYAVGGR